MNEFITIEQDFTESHAWKQHSESQRERSRNGKNKAQQKGCCASEGNDLRLLHLRILTASQAYGISA